MKVRMEFMCVFSTYVMIERWAKKLRSYLCSGVHSIQCRLVKMVVLFCYTKDVYAASKLQQTHTQAQTQIAVTTQCKQ